MKLKRSHYTSIIRSVDLIYVMKDNNHIPNLLGRCKNSNKIFCVHTGLHFTHKHEGPMSHKRFPPPTLQCSAFQRSEEKSSLAFLPNELKYLLVFTLLYFRLPVVLECFLFPKAALLQSPDRPFNHHLIPLTSTSPPEQRANLD